MAAGCQPVRWLPVARSEIDCQLGMCIWHTHKKKTICSCEYLLVRSVMCHRLLQRPNLMLRSSINIVALFSLGICWIAKLCGHIRIVHLFYR
jgi:hypothetical protein